MFEKGALKTWIVSVGQDPLRDAAEERQRADRDRERRQAEAA